MDRDDERKPNAVDRFLEQEYGLKDHMHAAEKLWESASEEEMHMAEKSSQRFDIPEDLAYSYAMIVDNEGTDESFEAYVRLRRQAISALNSSVAYTLLGLAGLVLLIVPLGVIADAVIGVGTLAAFVGAMAARGRHQAASALMLATMIEMQED